MEVVDHYTSIMSFLAAGKGHPRVQSLPLEDRQRVLEEAARVEHERNEYVGRGWYSKEVFLPVKLGMDWVSILGLYNWAHVFLQANLTESSSAARKLPPFVRTVVP